MQMSDKGLAALIADEGEVLRAYRDVAGVWTIGVGLTAASGVIAPKAGMTITRAQSRVLLAEALERNYAPAVRKRLGVVPQHVFDAALSFHFNTGAISRASWVAKYQRGDLAGAEAAFKSWNRAGGRIVAGLTKRRAREWELLARGRYPSAVADISASAPRGTAARTAVAIALVAGFATPLTGLFGWSTAIAVGAAAAAGFVAFRWRSDLGALWENFRRGLS